MVSAPQRNEVASTAGETELEIDSLLLVGCGLMLRLSRGRGDGGGNRTDWLTGVDPVRCWARYVPIVVIKMME